jgi:hypothetical protein
LGASVIGSSEIKEINKPDSARHNCNKKMDLMRLFYLSLTKIACTNRLINMGMLGL